jgi:hypothetical protein
MRTATVAFLLALALAPAAVTAAEEKAPAWATAYTKGPPGIDETRAFMKRLARYVFDHHLKKDPKSAQRGMVYEYVDTTRLGQFDQFVQGEALDTMHDGAWLAAALVQAYRATGDPFYKEFLTRWLLPFYCRMLNHSDTLFSAKRDDSRPGAHRFDREHALQEGEKGFVPYWWDDGGSVSLERRRDRNPRGPFSCTDRLADQPKPRFLLDGWSHGSSNHLAQDLGVMLQSAWLLLRESKDDEDRKLAAEVAEAAKNLQQCRMRHHGHIPMCDSPAALALADAALLQHVPDQGQSWRIDNHYYRALYDFKPGQRMPFPGFADDQEYHYCFGLARHGGKPPRALAFRTIYDAFTEPMLYRAYSDDAEVPPGINRFDLHPYYARDGKPEDYRSDRKGPGGKPRPIGSRMGPQNMVCCGWALQLLRAFPGVWEEPFRREHAKDLRVYLNDSPKDSDRTEGGVAAVELPRLTFNIYATRTGLTLQGKARDDKVSLAVFSRPDGKGTFARVTIKAKGTRAVNDKGEALQCGSNVAGEESLAFLVVLPWTADKGQKAWANGVEHGRYSVRVGDEVRSFYLASPESQAKAWLEHELAGGLRTWEAIFQEKGFIPTGIDAGPEWDRFSDCGGYAHLIAAAAQWLLVLGEKRDWEQQGIPSLPSPK